ncbi:MAG: hypothetical protein NUW02_00930 [Candidatus Campbellbacteria bacterium]|nr:hypothetical protein [Candidatus Campbellbacteria bacterium]
MKKYLLGIAVVALSVVGFASFNIQNASAVDACNHISVGFSRSQLPLNTYPAFTITGPAGTVISSSRFFPGNGQTFQSVNTTNSGAPLPPGGYRIDVEPMAGTSRLVLINAGNPPTATIQCPFETSILFFLGYEPAAPSGGPSLRMNPAPQTVQAGSNPAIFGSEYSADGGSWNDVSGYTTFSSPQEGTIIHNAGSPHGGNLQEILGLHAGVAQINAMYAGLTISSNLTVTSGAPPSPHAPNCQMRSNPETATGGTVTLAYTVGYLPTTISIEADDAPATPSGTPTVGAPDPARADSQQTGSIVTGPITKDTVFTMTVSNSHGTRHCDLEVPFVAAPEAGLRLPLVATLLDLPNLMVYPGPRFGTQNIQSAAYANGAFAFSGACGGPKDQNYLSSYPPFRQGGAWFFKDDGTLISQRDLCMDGGSRFQTLFFHGNAESQMVADGDRGFFMAVRSNGGSVSGNTYGAGAEHAGYYQVSGGGVLFSPSSNFIIRNSNFAAANGKVIGNVQVGLDGNSGRDVTLSTPSLQILAEREEHSLRPLVGFGDYILGRVGNSSDRCTTPVSYTPTVFRAESDGGITSVQELTLPDNLCPGRVAIDYTSTPKRLAVTSHTGQSGRNLNYSNRIFLFTSGANGLEPAGELTVPESVLTNINRRDMAIFPAFAVAGSYLVFAGYPGIDERYFTLWHDGTLAGVAEAPLRRDYGTASIGESAGQPLHLFMTPQGKIMAGGIRNAYLFDSNVVPVGPPVPPVPPGDGGGGGGEVPGCHLPTLQVSGTQVIGADTMLSSWLTYTSCVIQTLYSQPTNGTVPLTKYSN